MCSLVNEFIVVLLVCLYGFHRASGWVGLGWRINAYRVVVGKYFEKL
jgi:hypothetical protein